ncbi:MAG: LysR family transcriptional regulator [Proteobacteria bacterium]|nr:LysR family transcriptional regulator [Pseudomonadota bacterium]
MRIDLSLRQLEAFAQVATSGSFRRAAAELGQAQPVISRLIGQAEQTLGVRLFDRDTRRVEITAAGRELLPIARRILRDFDGALSELGDFMQGRSGHVTVAALPSTGAALVPQAMVALQRTHPAVQFTLIEAPADALLAVVEEGRADLGLSVRPAPQQRLRYQPLLDDPLMLLCRADDPLAARASVPWSVFAQRPFIASALHSSIRPLTDAVFMQRRITPRPALEYPSVSACGALVAAGLGISALPRLTLGLMSMEGLAAVPLVRPQASRAIGIVTRIGRTLPPVAHAFMATLLAQHGSARA